MGIAAALFLAMQGLSQQPATVIGPIVDPVGLAVPAAKVGVSTTRTEVARDGTFNIAVAPGKFSLVVSANGFREKTIESLSAESGRRIDLGKVTIVPRECEDPGFFCDDIGRVLETLQLADTVGATIRAENTRTTTGKDGAFHLELAPGQYRLFISARGFQERVIENVALKFSRQLDLGSVRLNVSGCDAPGAICDYFGNTPPPPPLRCDSARRLFLEPGNGAQIGESWDRLAHAPIRIDGRGPNSGFCVRTNKGNLAHVFLIAQVPLGADSVSLYYVTRKP